MQVLARQFAFASFSEPDSFLRCQQKKRLLGLMAHGSISMQKENGLRDAPNKKDPCKFLVFEDFGTTGLRGDIEQAFDEPGNKNSFYYFFRAEGRTGKK